MNPALLIKLRPTGPWRIGPDSGARNQVDAIYHSDTLYSAVTSAMLRLGRLQEWLGATAANGAPALCFSSCFPFLDEIGFVVPPRTIWPPSSPALLSARVRWKSARFVPLGIVQGLLSGQSLDEDHWAVDGPSACLVPVGRPGPFRLGLRFNAAVDRLTGAAERHSVACLEFRPGAGLWTVVRFADQAARDHWLEPVRTAFRLLSDSGFGGERSLGWGRAEMPEFTEGTLPDMILAPAGQALPPADDHGAGPPANETSKTLVPSEAPQATAAPDQSLDLEVAQALPPADDTSEFLVPSETAPSADVPDQSHNGEQAAESPIPNPQSPVPDPLSVTPVEPEAPVAPPGPGSQPPAPDRPKSHWLLSLFAPAPTDSIDWSRGNYTVLIRGGRVEAPTRSGDLKRHIRMVAEGSVLYAPSAPGGAAPDVAPQGFAHPVFRAGFAVSIPLPEAAHALPPAVKVT
jgi:CRISPR type III-A-associated RAMP protein Csm4